MAYLTKVQFRYNAVQ